MSLEALKPQISEHIQQRVNAAFCKPELAQLLRKMYALDAVLKTNSLESRIDKIVADTINPERDFLRRQWDSVGLPLLKGMLGTSQNYGSTITMGFRVVGTLHGLYSIASIIDNVYTELVKRLARVNRDSLTMTLVLQQNFKMSTERARDASELMRSSNIIDNDDNLCININDDDSERLKNELAKCHFFTSKEQRLVNNSHRNYILFT